MEAGGRAVVVKVVVAFLFKETSLRLHWKQCYSLRSSIATMRLLSAHCFSMTSIFRSCQRTSLALSRCDGTARCCLIFMILFVSVQPGRATGLYAYVSPNLQSINRDRALIAYVADPRRKFKY